MQGNDNDEPVDPGDLQAVAGHLYGLPPADFMSERTRLAAAAKHAGAAPVATQIKALRRPTVAAWAINHLVRRRPDSARDLLALADRLRSAHTRLDATALRELRSEREEVLSAFVAAAVDEAQQSGQKLSPAVRDDVHATAVAALADFDAGQAVASGTLTRALHYSGFGEVDIADAVASTATGVKLAVLQGGRDAGAPSPSTITDGEQVAAAELAKRTADREAAVRERREQQRRQQLEAAQADVTDARRRVSELVRELAAANDELAQAEARLADMQA